MARKKIQGERLGQILEWIALGHSQADILGALEADHPGEDHRRTLRAALERLLDEAEDLAPEHRHAWALRAARLIYRRCIATHDYKDALAALKQYCRLARLYDAAAGEATGSTAAPGEKPGGSPFGSLRVIGRG